MSLKRYSLLILALAGLVSGDAFAQDSLRGQETRFSRQLNENDQKVLRDFVESKEGIDVKQKASNLDISGDVRFEWQSLHEKGNIIYIQDNEFKEKYGALRGGDCVDYNRLPLSNNDFDVEFNLKIKYTFGDAWAMAQLQCDNSAGIGGFNFCDIPVNFFPDVSSYDSDSSEAKGQDVGSYKIRRNNSLSGKGSGSSGGINLKRAYAGYKLFADGVHRLDVELGRRKLSDIFTSDIQFSSRFDGLLLKYTTEIKNFAGFYCYAGTFVIDERVNQFGYATEIGLLDILDSGFDIRYSFIDWTKRGRNRCFAKNPIGLDFMNSEISFAYRFEPEIYSVSIPAKIYGGFLLNHAAKKTKLTHHMKKNMGLYLGLYVGEVEKKGDWSFDVEYILVQAQAVSDFDVSSIGRGNILDDHLTEYLYDNSSNIKGNEYADASVSSSGWLSDISPDNFKGSSSSSGSQRESIFLPRRGNANFKGWSWEFLYAITDNLSVDVEYEFSHAEDDRVGGKHKYSHLKVESIYAF
jgi:hypothetical protein